MHSHVHSILTRSGEPRLVTWSGKRLTNKDGTLLGVLAIGNDITELHQTQKKLIQSERLAAIGQMVTGLAHESRNALQRAKASLEVLSLDLADQPQLDGLIDRAQRGLEELRFLYEEVRNYAEVLKLQVEAVNLVELIEFTWEHLLDQWQPKNVRLQLDSDNSIPIARVDRLKLHQVFRNILENALAESAENSVIEVNLHEVSLDGKRACQISITDQGPGMSEEQLGGIFQPFYTTKTRGTGLGMAIVQRIMDAHDGFIKAENTGTGARIILTLPS